MKTIDELIRELDSSTGEELYRAIRELGGHGDAARGALEPLLNLIRYHDDEVAVGHAILAVGPIHPRALDRADALADIGDAKRSARNVATMLNPEAARVLVSLLLETPIGTLDADANADPRRSRAILIEEIALKFPCVIPALVKALTTPNYLGDYLDTVLQWIGKDRPEVIHLLEPLLDHDSESIRDAALACAASTGRLPIEQLPLLIRAAHREYEQADDGKFRCALSHMADKHPRAVVAGLIDTLGPGGLDLLDVTLAVDTPSREILAEELIPLLGSPDPEFRRVAAMQFCDIGALASRAMPRLCELLSDQVLDVRNAACEALRRIGEHLAKTRG